MNKLKNIRIVLCRTSHPGNIGSAARAMKTMGLSRLYLVNPRTFPHENTYAMASGAIDILENVQLCSSLQQALAGCILVIGLTARKRELSHAALSLRDAVKQALPSAAIGDIAFVFGGETNGLSNDELILCQKLTHIPANPEYSSLNLAAALQVLAYELRMTTEDLVPIPPKKVAPASHEEIEGFYLHLEKTLIDIEFLDPSQPRRLMARLRRLYARAGLQKEEVNILRGILKSIQKTL